MRVFYRLLGDLEIGDEGNLLPLPTGRSLVVLAALLVNANRRISKTELLRAAWGDNVVGMAQVPKATLAIRELLRPVGRGDDIKTHAGYGYELRIPDSDLDMLCFRELTRQAEESGRQDTGEEADQLRAALRLWRGPHPLANVPVDSFGAEIDLLEQRRRRAAARLFDLEIAGGGDYTRILVELEQIAADYPDDQRLCEQLMIVQQRSGHPNDAIRAYERYAAKIESETGGTPERSLLRICYAISNGDDGPTAAAIAAIVQRVGTPERARVAAVPREAVVPRQLPPDPALLIGRDDLVAEAAWLLGRAPERTCPIIVITGGGGIGKTTLARRVAHLSRDRYPDGQLLMELRSNVGESLPTGEILAQFLRAFGVSSVPESPSERLSMYRTLLATRRVLVVLDDVSSGGQIRDLIPANRDCGVIVTSRRRLPDILGAHHLPVLEPLDRESATDLFIRIVSNAGIDVAGEAEAIDRVVALCGGLPLALQIAAALRVRDDPRPTAELADRLARQGPEALAYEDSSVALMIGAGFDRLAGRARRLLLGLSLLRLPTFGVWTVSALLESPAGESIALLSELVAASLAEPAASGGYRLHDLTRDYIRRRALEEIPAAERAALVIRSHQALLTLTRRAHAALYGGDYEVVHSVVSTWDAPAGVLAEIDEAPLEWFERERLNIRAAVEHCAELGMTDFCWDLAVSSHEFYTVRRYFDDWYATHTTALRACQLAGDGRGEGFLLTCLGQPALVASRHSGDVSSVAELRRSAALLAQSGDRHGQAIALRTLANALRRRGQLTQPLALFTEALEHYEASNDIIGRCLTLRFIGHTYLDLGRYEPALEFLRAAEAVARDQGQLRLLAMTWYWLGQTGLAMNDLDAAKDAFTAVLDTYSTPDSLGHAYAMHGLGDVARLRGEFTVAEQHLTVAVNLAREREDAVLEGRADLSVAALRRAQNRPEEESSALEKAVECFAACGAIQWEARALSILAAVYEERADQDAAQVALARVDELSAVMALPKEDLVDRRPQDRPVG